MNNLRFVRLLMTILLVAIATPLGAGHANPPAGDEPFPQYSPVITIPPEATGDPYEPNDSFGTVIEINNPAFLLFDFLAIDPPGDLDYFRFQSRAGDEVNFYLVENSPLEAVLTLYDANLAHLWADDWSEELDLCLFGPDQTELVCDNFLMNYELPASGSYYLQVTGLYPGNYSLYLWLADPVDVYEPNDDRLQATPIELDTTLDAALEEHDSVEFWEDKDYYQFSGLVGQSILAVADSAVFGSYVYPDLAIQDAGGNVLHSAGASTTRTELAFTLSSTGIYYVHISAACGEGGFGCQGGYQLQVRKTNEAPLSIYLPVTVYSPDLERDALVALYHSMNGDS